MRREWSKPQVIGLGVESTMTAANDKAWHMHFAPGATNDHVCPKCGEQLPKGTFECGWYDNHIFACKGNEEGPVAS